MRNVAVTLYSLSVPLGGGGRSSISLFADGPKLPDLHGAYFAAGKLTLFLLAVIDSVAAHMLPIRPPGCKMGTCKGK